MGGRLMEERRRSGMDYRQLRSGTQPCVLDYRKPITVRRTICAEGRQSLQQLRARSRSGHGKAPVAFSIHSGGCARLGRDGNPHASKSEYRREAAKAAGARQSKRVLLPAGSDRRKISFCKAICAHQLGQRDRARWTAATLARCDPIEGRYGGVSRGGGRHKLDVANVQSTDRTGVRSGARTVRYFHGVAAAVPSRASIYWQRLLQTGGG